MLKRAVLIGIGVVFLIIGLAIPVLAYDSHQRQQTVRNVAETINATIESVTEDSKEVTRTVAKDRGPGPTERVKETATVYLTRINISYTIDGRSGYSTDVRAPVLGGGPAEFDNATVRDRFSDRHTPGEEVTVYYLEESGAVFLQLPEEKRGFLIIPVMFGLVFAAGAFLLLYVTGLLGVMTSWT